MKKFWWIPGTVIVILGSWYFAFKNNQVEETYDTVILYRSGEFKKAIVTKYGVYCSASWYKYATDHVYLKPDGTAKNGPFDYKWTLLEFNSDADKIWYDKNCKEIK